MKVRVLDMPPVRDGDDPWHVGEYLDLPEGMYQVTKVEGLRLTMEAVYFIQTFRLRKTIEMLGDK